MAEHVSITDPNIHEPKGISTAAAKTVYEADGLGSGAWVKREFAHGSVAFINTTTPYTVTYPAAATKVAAVTFGSGGPFEMTESVDGRLTYTGTETRHFHIAYSVSLDQSAGANRDIELYVYKNGSVITNSTVITTTQTGLKVSTAGHTDVMLNQNDYLEIYVKNKGASGNVNFYTIYLFAMGMLPE